eukprot:188221-Hanusia_phi.AAC.1
MGGEIRRKRSREGDEEEDEKRRRRRRKGGGEGGEEERVFHLLALSNSSLTLAAPLPTNISTKSEPEQKMKGSFACSRSELAQEKGFTSAAMARANSVFPVPGGPHSRIPAGILAPTLRYPDGESGVEKG